MAGMRKLGLVWAAALALGVVVVPGSYAATATWRYGALAPSARDAGPSLGGFSASDAWADISGHKMRAGAHYSGGWTLYANFAEGWGYVCHSYGGGSTLGALIENPHSVTQNPVSAAYQTGGPGC